MKRKKKITEILEPGLTEANRAIIAQLAKEKEGNLHFRSGQGQQKKEQRALIGRSFFRNRTLKVRLSNSS